MRKIYAVLSFSLLFSISSSAQTKQSTLSSTIEKPAILQKSNQTGASNKTTNTCDTVNITTAATWTPGMPGVVATDGGGYLAGTNGYGDLAKVAYFNVTTTNASANYITKAMIWFGKANSNVAANLSKTININVYSGSSTTGPGSVLGTSAVTLGSIKSDIENSNFTFVTFATPIPVPSSKEFFLGPDFSSLTWSSSVKDSFSLVISGRNEVYSDENGGGWEKWGDGTWMDMYGLPNGENWGYDYGFMIFPIVSDVAAGCTSSTPVELISFTGERRNNINTLNWATANELNNIGFDVERSVDGKEFSKMAFVASKSENGNSSNGLKYEFSDEKSLSVTTYYRLKQLDKDGKFSYSPIVTLKGDKATKLEIANVYPNPAKEKLNVVVAAPSTARTTFIVTDITGKIVLQQAFQLISGDNNIALNVQNLKSGSYLIKVACDNGCESAIKKFIKD